MCSFLASYPGYGYRVLPDDKELQLPNNGEQTHLAVRRAPSPNPHSLATPSPRLGIRYFRRDHDDDDAELTVGNQSFLESEPRAPKHLRYVVPATSAGSRKQAGLIQVHFARPDDRSMIDVDGYWVLSGMIGDTALSGHCVLARSRVVPAAHIFRIHVILCCWLIISRQEPLQIVLAAKLGGSDHLRNEPSRCGNRRVKETVVRKVPSLMRPSYARFSGQN